MNLNELEEKFEKYGKSVTLKPLYTTDKSLSLHTGLWNLSCSN